MTMSAAKLKSYIAKHACPYCGDDDVVPAEEHPAQYVPDEPEHPIPAFVWEHYCAACNRHWTEIYELTMLDSDPQPAEAEKEQR